MFTIEAAGREADVRPVNKEPARNGPALYAGRKEGKGFARLFRREG